MSERRRSPRFPESRVLQVFGGKSLGEPRGSAYVYSISQAGLGLESDSVLEVGEKISFEIPIPVRVSGRVARVETHGARFAYGIAFERMPLVDRWFLRRYLGAKIK